MKNKKGFTLIELLAVIVVLAIIALITVPQILGMTSKSRNQASLRSLEGHIRNIDNQLAMDKFQNDTKSGSYTFENLNLENFPKKDHLRCEEYEVNNNVVYEAKNCLIDEKNYCYLDSQVIECSELENTLKNQILADNTFITKEPILYNTNWHFKDQNGLYSIDVTNGYSNGVNGKTYYFRGDVTNNYVKFGKWKSDLYGGSTNAPNMGGIKKYESLTECQNDEFYNIDCTKIHGIDDDMYWKIVRINEDGTIRMILDSEIDANYYQYSGKIVTEYMDNNSYKQYDSYTDVYYSKSYIKTIVDKWYGETLGSDEKYNSKVAQGNYFCEAATVSYYSPNAIMNATLLPAAQAYPYTIGDEMYIGTISGEYLPNYKCVTDGNGYGLVNSKVGLLTYDEVVFAGGFPYVSNDKFYLYNKNKLKRLNYWTMSPAGINSSTSSESINVWQFASDEPIVVRTSNTYHAVPVINLKASVMATKEYDEALGVDVYVVE